MNFKCDPVGLDINAAYVYIAGSIKAYLFINYSTEIKSLIREEPYATL